MPFLAAAGWGRYAIGRFVAIFGGSGSPGGTGAAAARAAHATGNVPLLQKGACVDRVVAESRRVGPELAGPQAARMTGSRRWPGCGAAPVPAFALRASARKPPRGKTAAPARALTFPGAAWAIRTPVHNRISSGAIRTPGANHRRPRLDRLRRRFNGSVSRCSQSRRSSPATGARRGDRAAIRVTTHGATCVCSPGEPGRERPVSRVTATSVHRARRRSLRVAAPSSPW